MAISLLITVIIIYLFNIFIYTPGKTVLFDYLICKLQIPRSAGSHSLCEKRSCMRSQCLFSKCFEILYFLKTFYFCFILPLN